MKVKVYDNKDLYIENNERTKHKSNISTILEFEFGDRWADYNKYIEFKTDEEEWMYLLENDTFKVPYEVSKHRQVQMDVRFMKNENGNTIKDFSEVKSLFFEPSINATELESLEKHPDVIERIVEKTNELEEDVSELEQSSHSHSNKEVLDNTTASYTSEEETKLENIEAGAQVNKIEKIKVNGTEQTISNKEVDIPVPTDLDDLNEDSTHRTVTDTEKSTWNNKSDFSGNYDDLSNKPSIPSKTSDLNNDSGFITKDVNNLTYYTLKTSTGSFIDLSINSSNYVITMQLKDIDGNVISTDTIDLPLESVVVSGRYDDNTKKVILTLENGSEVDFSVADLVAGLQTELSSSNKLNADYIDDTNSGKKLVTTTEKNTWNGKFDASKVKSATSTTSGDVYDVIYINTLIGDLETALTNLNTEAEAI